MKVDGITKKRLPHRWGILLPFLFALLVVDARVPVPGFAASQPEREAVSPAFEHVHALTMDAAGKTLWMGTHAGLFRSEDGGNAWRPVRISSEHTKSDIMSIVADSRDPRVIYVGTHEAGIFKTGDGGSTWRQVNNGLGGVDIHGLAYDPNHPGKLHAAVRDGAAGIYRTRNAGREWVRVDDGPTAEVKVLASVNIPTGMGGIFLYAGTSEGLFRSPD